MGGTCVLERREGKSRSVPSFQQYVADYFRGDEAFISGIRSGIADLKAGRVKPWLEIEKRLGIGQGRC